MRESLHLKHEKILSEAIRHLAYPLSDYSFANLYLFRQIHQYVVNFGEHLSVQGITRRGDPFIMPLFPLNQISPDEMRAMLARSMLFPIPLEALVHINPTLFTVNFLEEDSDYLYEVSSLRDYPGRHLESKRNLVHQFLDRYECTPQWLDRLSFNSCLNVLDSWQDESGQLREQTDYTSCLEVLEMWDRFSWLGRGYVIDTAMRGFILGEYLNESTVVIRFAKASRAFKGIYQYMYQEFVRSLPNQVRWINMEADLGMESLRKAKRSYHPEKLLHKYRLKAL